MTGKESPRKPLFRDLNPEEADPETMEIESLCVNCGENGLTKLLLTKIPHYKEIIIMSFDCPHCQYQNNEIQSGGQIQEKGIKFILNVKSPEDLNRQVVKSDFASIKIPEIDFEIPSQSQKGEVTTVEGIIGRAVQGLSQDQDVRKVDHPEVADKIDRVISELENLKNLVKPFTMEIEDISGNSFVENPRAPLKDLNCETRSFARKPEEDRALAIYPNSSEGEPQESQGVLGAPQEVTYEDLLGEVLTFPTNCPSCNSPCETNMKVTNIPYFKEVVIMATNCEACGARTNEVKSGGGVEEKGTRIELNVSVEEDLSRDVLKSETCSLEIPELELEVGPSTLGGKFTTVEGLLEAVRQQLSEHSGLMSDSKQASDKDRMKDFLVRLTEVIRGQRPVTLILDDPAGNCYVQSLTAPEPDPKMKVTKYERSFDQNEDLGINDMKTTDY